MATLTPMMAQYKELKAQYPDAILMYRLGDFYEMFFEDAMKASKILQITLTSRNKNEALQIPMCGVPFHAAEGYLAKLTRAGQKVALCEQVSEPDGKGIVRREVVRVVTPGTTFNEGILEHKAHNYITAVVKVGREYGLAYADITTGVFYVMVQRDLREVAREIARIAPAECIGAEEIFADLHCADACVFAYHYQGDAYRELTEHFGVKNLEMFGIEAMAAAQRAAASLLAYLKETQKTDLAHLRSIRLSTSDEYMTVDESCIRNLELLYTQRAGAKQGSLLSVLDHTVSAMGGRMLVRFLLHPLRKREAIVERLDRVGVFFENASLRRQLREVLSKIFDIERLLARLSLGSGNARDLLAMRESLRQIPEIVALLAGHEMFLPFVQRLHTFDELVAKLTRALCDEPPMSVHEGGMIREGFCEELDEFKRLSAEGKTFLQNLQKREIERTGINSLKVKYNKVSGYYIEISKAQMKAVPEDYIRKQTLVNAERFITPELKEYEEKVLSAEERVHLLEYELFYGLRMEVVRELGRIQDSAGALAELDVCASCAHLAVHAGYCRPEICDERIIDIHKGRHPVIEHLMGSQSFVPNDTQLDEKCRCLLITGPNMGGKSTFLRQTALIVLMAHIGCFVPAERARIGVTDRIFTRVGASDNLTRGQSTFMVEMQEMSHILHHATDRSLIILDEVGRGTSTYDGVSIAWAIFEYLHTTVGSFTLFATHYHEMIELAERLPSACNFNVLAQEDKEGVRFLYKVVEGGADKSYGIEVARLAGFPAKVLKQAYRVLQEHEGQQLNLFTPRATLAREHQEIATDPSASPLPFDPLREKLQALDVNTLTPVTALVMLEELTALLRREG